MAHDQLFKELLWEFFAEFMQLFHPDVAARIQFSSVEFLDKELFTDRPRGKVREPDVVARVETTEGDHEIVVIHIEVQRRRGRQFGTRMAEYYALLRLRHRVPVFPIVLYLSRGTGGIGLDHYQELVFGYPVLTYDYFRIGVPDLAAAEYLDTGNPLAYGLAALMKPGSDGPAATKAACLLRIARAVLDEARKLLLTNCVETYLQLDQTEQQKFERIMREPALEEVKEMLSVYELRGEERGIAKGIATGTLQGKRDLVQRMLRHKFGQLPEAVLAHIQALETEAELDHLTDAILDASSLADLRLNGAHRNGHTL